MKGPASWLAKTFGRSKDCKLILTIGKTSENASGNGVFKIPLIGVSIGLAIPGQRNETVCSRDAVIAKEDQ